MARIRAQLDELAKLDPGDAWRWETEPTWSEAELAAFEAEHFTLPPDYRVLYKERAAAAWPQFFQADFDKLATNQPVSAPPNLMSDSPTNPPRLVGLAEKGKPYLRR